MKVKLHLLFIIGQIFTTYFLPDILTAVASFCKFLRRSFNYWKALLSYFICNLCLCNYSNTFYCFDKYSSLTVFKKKHVAELA